MAYRPIVTTSMATQIADVIQQAILDGTLRINERLASEEELAAQFGVSRPTVREALKRLAARHL
ncbi:MAG: winged helix-turn-helix domain-containing protein, partial [Rhizomicrobium sp.]